jgi:two-component system sensor histidine kinase ChvG
LKLRRQLILVSLLTLSLPWAGCQYIREMEGALREGQSRAMLATAEAVANRLASEPLLVAELTQSFANVTSDAQFYAHPLTSAVVLDGYDDEWRDLNFSGRKWQEDNLSLQVNTAFFNKHVYLFIRVDDPELIYYHPGQRQFTDSDYIVLRTLDRDGRVRDFVIVASAPGAINAYDINTPHHEWLMREDDDVVFAEDNIIDVPRRQEHNIRGIWQERSGGYQIEIQIPTYLTQGYLGVALFNADATSPQWLGSITVDSPPAPLVTHSDTLRETLSVFASDDLRLRIATNNQWLVASAGKINNPSVTKQDWITALLRMMFTQQHFPRLENPELNGRLETTEITRALAGEQHANWYQNRQGILARAASPILINQRVIGAVVAEQTSAGLLALTDTAFRRLIIYTVFATALAGMGLIAYASWLSLRIRRLSRAADSAIGEDGKLSDAFIPSDAKDEIGDLSRSYNQLLIRVQEYTDYLRTLSNKLSHELRTPLAVVRSSLDNLDNENLGAQAKIYAARAQEGSQRLSAILNAISSASRVEESIHHADMNRFPLDKVVRELTLAYKDVAAQKIIFECDAAQNYTLYGSADLIVQMIDKLFDNACDFCPPAGAIQFALKRNKNDISLTVSNDGPLLPKKMQSQLFDSLVSIRDNSDKSKSENHNEKIHLGLGLHIVRLIVELHQARIIARNREDHQGVEFEIFFQCND